MPELLICATYLARDKMNKKIRSSMGTRFDYKEEYINMIQYFNYTTRTGKPAYSFKFLTPFTETSVKSRAAYLLLRHKLRCQDETYKTVVRGRYKWLKFREKFLRDYKQIHGSFVCKFCGRPDLRDAKKQCDDYQVTLDHIIPRSKGGEMYETTNLAICCYLCNKLKDAFSVENFERKCSDYLRGHRRKFNYKG